MIGNYIVNPSSRLYYLKKEDIEKEAEYLVKKYFPECIDNCMNVPIDLMIEKMEVNLEFRKLSANKEILGACVFKDGTMNFFDENNKPFKEIVKANTIIINSDLADDNDIRTNFTLGHELGHKVLQGPLYIDYDDQISLFENEGAILCKREYVFPMSSHKNLVTKLDWMEWQVKYFASAILIPRSSIYLFLHSYIEKYKDVLDKPILENLSNKEKYELITSISERYEVSFEMSKNRLSNLGLIGDYYEEVVGIWS